jgi:predicted nuclease of restriction endonuclease-like RecB superfamily
VETAYRLSSSVEGDRLVLHYLTPRDEPWLRVLLDECARFAGKRAAELHERLQEPLPKSAPRHKLRLAARVLERLLPESPARDPSPREVRFRVFRAARDEYATRRQVFERVARELRAEVDRIEDGLFADLASQRRVAALPQDLSPSRLALLTNQALVLAYLKRAERVRIRAWGSTHALVRHAHRLGLICVVSRAASLGPGPADALPGVVLEISGPFALFHKTEVYGRSLSSLLPRALRCQHFELEADCVLGHGAEPSILYVSPYDPIYPARELPSFDSRVAARFARDFVELAPDWHIVREPEPIDADGTLIFSDFELVHRHEPERRCFLEIVGFWTPAYLRAKLAKIAAAKLAQVILCVDESRRCSDDDLPENASVLRYKTRVDVAAVLALLRRGAPP